MSTRRGYSIGFLGSFALGFAVLSFLYATTLDPANTESYLLNIVMGVAGLALAMVTVKLRVDPFDMRALVTDIMWTVACVTVIWVVNQAVPLPFTVDPISARIFRTLTGVMEECIFRVWLCTWFYEVTRSILLAVAVSAGAWSVMHNAMLGGNLGGFLIIFGAGCVLGLAMLSSRRGDGPIMSHVIVNWLA